MGKAQGPVEIFPHATRQAARSTTTQNKLVPFSLSFLYAAYDFSADERHTRVHSEPEYTRHLKVHQTSTIPHQLLIFLQAAQVPCVVLQHKYIRQVEVPTYPVSYEILLEFLWILFGKRNSTGWLFASKPNRRVVVYRKA